MVFKKGEVTNPKGRPIGAKGKMSHAIFEELLETINRVESNKAISGGKTLLEHLVTRAFRNDVVAVQILKKLVPDKHFEELMVEEPKSIKFEIVSTLYSQAEEMIKYASESMSKEIELLQNKKISIPEFKDNMIKLMVEKVKEEDEFINNQNQEKEEEKDTGNNEKSSSE